MNVYQKFTAAMGIALLFAGTGILTYERFYHATGLRRDDSGEIQKTQANLREAEEYLRQNTHESAEEAMKRFNRILSEEWNEKISDQARYGLAVSLDRLGEGTIALDHLRLLKKRGVKDPALSEKVDYYLGKILISINHVDEGRALLDRLLNTSKDDRLRSDIHTVIGLYHLSTGKFKKSIESFSVALEYNPENMNAELGRARAAKGKNRGVSYAYYDDYLLGNSHLEPMRRSAVYSGLKSGAYEKGITAYRKGRYDDAIYYLHKAAEHYTDSETGENALYWIGESHLAAGDQDRALETFQRVLENSNDHRDQSALMKRGIIYFNQSDYKRATQIFDSLIEEYPDGKYSVRAREWREESMMQMREKELLESYQEDGF
jgi:TolA-binding protein